jgi:hypothetical protein
MLEKSTQNSKPKSTRLACSFRAKERLENNQSEREGLFWATAIVSFAGKSLSLPTCSVSKSKCGERENRPPARQSNYRTGAAAVATKWQKA